MDRSVDAVPRQMTLHDRLTELDRLLGHIGAALAHAAESLYGEVSPSETADRDRPPGATGRLVAMIDRAQGLTVIANRVAEMVGAGSDTPAEWRGDVEPEPWHA